MSKEPFNWVRIANGVPCDVSAASLKADFSGYMMMESGFIKTWKKMYFVLSGNGLYYFENMNSTSKIGVVALKVGSTVCENCNDIKESRDNQDGLMGAFNSFMSMFGSDNLNSNSFYIRADHYSKSIDMNSQFIVTALTAEDKTKWIKALRANIEKTAFETIRIVTINPPALRFRALPEQVNIDAKFAKSFFGMNLGVMMFSKQEIPKYCLPTDKFDTTFTNGDDIFMRFSMKHAIRNYPAFDFMRPNAVYFPPDKITSYYSDKSHTLMFQAFMYVDGRRISRKDQPIPGGFTHVEYEGGETSSPSEYDPATSDKMDFYAIAQTMTFPIYTKAKQSHQEFDKSVLKAGAALYSLPEGEHNVRIDMYYVLVPTEENLHGNGSNRNHKFPYAATDPVLLCSGEFKFISSGNSEFASPLPKRVPGNEDLELAIFNLLKNSMEWGARKKETEEPIYVVVQGNWSCSRKENLYNNGYNGVVVAVTETYEILFDAVLYRNPLTGWNEESVVVFHLVAYAKDPNPPYQIINIGVIGHEVYEVDDLPGSFTSQIKRCPPEFR